MAECGGYAQSIQAHAFTLVTSSSGAKGCQTMMEAEGLMGSRPASGCGLRVIVRSDRLYAMG